METKINAEKQGWLDKGLTPLRDAFKKVFRLKPAEMWSENGHLECDSLENWLSALPVSPEYASSILLRDLPPSTFLTVDVRGGLLNSASSQIFDSGYAYRGNVSFNLARKTAYFDLVRDETPNNAVGRTMMRNQIEFLNTIGIRELKLFAALQAGGYVHARAGFLPGYFDVEGLTLNRREISHFARERYNELSPLLTAGEKAESEPLLAVREARDLWRMADLRADLTERLKTSFTSAANQTSRFVPQHKNDHPDLSEQFFARVRDGKKVTLGQALLAGSQWTGSLDFTNKEQMARAGNYLGGWKYINCP